METLTNGLITIKVKEHGAELASIKRDGREFLWQADEKFWKRHSPVLFPIVGAVWNGEYRTKGATYKMGQHGFARDMDFSLIKKTEDEIRYRLVSNDETRAKFPYDFSLEIGYRLIDNRVRVIWCVKNTGQEELPFQIGAHPAFFWDGRGFFKIEARTKSLPISVITENGCVGRESEINLDNDGFLALDEHTFDNDALIFEDSLVRKVSLCDENRHEYISLEFDSPLVGLWSPPKKNAPFICIEPWFGRADSVGFDRDFKEKKWIQTLQPSAVFEASYDIIIA